MFAGQSIQILLVDDSDSIQRMMRHHLVNAGFGVTIAADGRQAAALALRSMRAGRCFDLIFMDLEMPKLNGYKAFQRIRTKGYRGAVVALTACAGSSVQLKCEKLGFDSFAEKPITKPKLLSLISRLIQKN